MKYSVDEALMKDDAQQAVENRIDDEPRRPGEGSEEPPVFAFVEAQEDDQEHRNRQPETEQQHPRHQADEIAEEHHLAVDPGGRGIGPVGGHHLQRLVGDIEFDIALDALRHLVLELFEIASRVLPKGMARRMSPIR